MHRINSKTLLGISKNGNIYLIINDEKPKFYNYNLETNLITEVIVNTKYTSIHFGENFTNNEHFFQNSYILNIENDKFYGEWSEEIEGKKINRKDLISFEIENDKIEIINNFENFESNRYVNNFVNTDEFNYFRIHNNYMVNYIAIEEDKYKYYSSINQKDINKEMLNLQTFPNPATKGENINIELNEYAEKVTIYDLFGNEIYSVNQFSNKFEIPTTNLNSGIYIIVIDLGGKRKISKFVVE